MYKFPKGNADFKELRKEGFVYIDKTKYIELLENSANKSVHILRPKRFGKTLFTSMLGHYYDLNMADDFDDLFKGTYIHEHPTTKKNKYFVLKFNFAGMSGKRGEELEKTFDRKVYLFISTFCEKYGFKNTIPPDSHASLSLFNLIEIIRNQIKDHKVYVIIDEYDHFANDLLSFDFDGFTSATRSDGYIRAFYEELKNGTDGVIEKIFITGVSPITLDSLTSGFNISTNLSLDSDFNEIMGFTTEEMKHLISLVEYIRNPEETLSKMKQIYDGYKFAKDAENHIYNPNMALYYLDYYQRKKKEPEEVIDPNIYSDYKKIENLLNIKPDSSQQQIIADILSDKILKCKLTVTYEVSSSFSKDDFVSLLYYLGYLTICGSIGPRVLLKVPNEVMKNVYFDYFRKMLNHEGISSDKDLDAVDCILYDKDNSLFVEQLENILNILDNRDYMKFDEGRLKVACAAICKGNSSVLFKSEYPVPNGFVDIVLSPNEVKGATALIELKYIKSKDFTEPLLQQKREVALNELKKYELAKEFQNKDIVKWIVIFSNDKCVLNEKID